MTSILQLEERILAVEEGRKKVFLKINQNLEL